MVTDAELSNLRSESAIACEMQLKWQQRGPPSTVAGETWRGQKFRQTGGENGLGRWGNSGGQNKEFWRRYYQAKGKGKSCLAEFKKNNAFPTKQ